MDKYEFKVSSDEINNLISQGEYEKAVKIADSIDWRRVKSIKTLCRISDLYKINRRYEDSREILLLAYDKQKSRMIVQSLCELSIKLGDIVNALEYYKEFVQLSPDNSGKYVLQYRIYEAQDVSLEERIEVLEELKKHDYEPKWAYELAYLYHRVGLETKCIEECDEMILFFGDGPYVMKAYDLKMLHTELSQEQAENYDKLKNLQAMSENEYAKAQEEIKKKALEGTEEEEDGEFDFKANQLTDDTKEIKSKNENSAEPEIEVKPVDVSQYNTINLQRELAEGMREFLEAGGLTETEEVGESENVLTEENHGEEYHSEENISDSENQETNNQINQTDVVPESVPVIGEDSRTEEDDFTRAMIYETPLISEFEEKEKEKENEENSEYVLHQNTDEMKPITGPIPREEIFFGNTSEVKVEELVSELDQQKTGYSAFEPISQVMAPQEDTVGQMSFGTNVNTAIPNAGNVTNTGIIQTFHKPSGYDDILSQEYDGQISLVVPEEKRVEKQITGQISIDDVMAEWERIKKEEENKRKEEIRKRIRQESDSLFANFDEQTKSGLLEELENAMISAAAKSGTKLQEKPKVVKVSDIERIREEKRAAENEKAISEAEERVQMALLEDELEDNIKEELREETPEQPLAEQLAETITEEAKQPKEDEDISESTEEADSEKEAEELVLEEETEEENDSDDTQESKKDESFEITGIPEETKEAVSSEKDDSEVEEETEEESDAEEPEDSDKVDTNEEKESTEKPKKKGRDLTDAEKEQFAPFVHRKKTRRQIAEAIDNISLASYTGNVIVTGEEGPEATAFAKLLVKEVQLSDSNFSGKVAKITASILNKKNVDDTLNKLSNGALIIEGAAALKDTTVENLCQEMNQEEKGLIVILEDTKAKMEGFLAQYPKLHEIFTSRVDLVALDDQTLVRYAKKYALEQEYSIDDFGMLALHTRISDMQTSNHEVSISEIEEIVDEAIYYANKKTPKHFFDILFGKRYDSEDMIILSEKDFMHY